MLGVLWRRQTGAAQDARWTFVRGEDESSPPPPPPPPPPPDSLTRTRGENTASGRTTEVRGEAPAPPTPAPQPSEPMTKVRGEATSFLSRQRGGGPIPPEPSEPHTAVRAETA